MARSFNTDPRSRRHGNGQAVISIRGSRFTLGRWGEPITIRTEALFVERWRRAGMTAEKRSLNRMLEEARRDARIELRIPEPRDLEHLELAMTVFDLVEAYVDENLHGRNKVGKINGYQFTGLRKLVKKSEMFASLEADTVDATDVERWVDSIAAGRKPDGSSTHTRTTINRRLAMLKDAFVWGTARGMVRDSAMIRVKSVTPLRRTSEFGLRESSRKVPVDDKTIRATLAELSPMTADLVRLLRVTGWRGKGEAFDITPDQIEQDERGWLFIPRSSKVSHHTYDQPRLPINPTSREILRRYWPSYPTERFFTPEKAERLRAEIERENREPSLYEKYGDRVRPNAGRDAQRKDEDARIFGDTYTSYGLNQSIGRAAERAGVEKWTFGRLRHSFTTELERRGIDAQHALGHRTRRMTDNYTHTQRDEALKLASIESEFAA